MNYLVSILFLSLSVLTLSAGALADDGCDKPRDDFDGLYCLNKIYIQADKDLNENYGKVAAKLDKDGKALLKFGQLKWISDRNARCSYRDPQRGFFVNLNCATSTTIERTKFLSDRYRECISAGCLNSKLQ